MTAPVWSEATSAFGSSVSPSVAVATVGLNDILFAQITTDGTGTLTLPAGWLWAPRSGGTSGRGGTISANQTTAYWAYKICDGLEDGVAQTFTLSVSANWYISIHRITGANPHVPFAGTRCTSATVNTCSFSGLYAGFGGGLGMNFLSANGRFDFSATNLGGTTTNWTEVLTGRSDATYEFHHMAYTNSVSVASASASALATGSTLAIGLDHHGVTYSVVFNSADTDFTIPQRSADTADILAGTAGAGGTTASVDLATSYFVNPGMFLVGFAQMAGSAVATLTVTVDGGSNIVESTDADGTNSRSCFMFAKRLVSTDLDGTTATVLATFSVSGAGTLVASALASLTSALLVQEAYATRAAGTTPQPPDSGDFPGANHTAICSFGSGSSSNTIGTLTGFTVESTHGHTGLGTVKLAMFVNEGALVAGDEAPPAGAGFSNTTHNTYTVLIGEGATILGGNYIMSGALLTGCIS